MAVLKLRNSTDTGWIIIGGAGGCEVTQSDSEPASPYAGMLWLDTDAPAQSSGMRFIESFYELNSTYSEVVFDDLDTSFNEYVLIGSNCVPDRTGCVLGLQVSSDNGSSWTADTMYQRGQTFIRYDGTFGSGADLDGTSWYLHYAAAVEPTNIYGGLQFNITITGINEGDTNFLPFYNGTYGMQEDASGGGFYGGYTGGSRRSSIGTVNALRVYWTNSGKFSGISTARITLYGLYYE